MTSQKRIVGSFGEFHKETFTLEALDTEGYT